MGYNANNFAWYNPVNGKMELFMAVKNGQLFVKEAFLDKASIREMVLSESIRSDNYVPGKSGFIIDVKNNKLEMYGGNGGTTLT
ncbi:phage tail tip fiber protein, partial [Proteus mirabilis]|uniref:phage tail tip fiber protein n=1 Tax=Proteus mirabilis TaxID=584 RepID=UPI003BF8C7EE